MCKIYIFIGIIITSIIILITGKYFITGADNIDTAYSDNTFSTLPGLNESSKSINKNLHTAFIEKKGNYEIRTQHTENNFPKYINRLIFENSPYLLQHAHNPVNWYPWSTEAFTTAKERNLPIFLSIGYSTCHWCHVMEHESFDNEAIAEILNENFICIKVDREQHPDIDEIYMTGVQIITGRGGWPMSSFLNHSGEPFFAGTYFPPDSFKSLLMRISKTWAEDYQYIEKTSKDIMAKINQINKHQKAAGAFDLGTLQQAYNLLLKQHDAEFGGFRSAPKFPNEVSLILLLDAAKRSGNIEQLNVISNTLDAMQQGGIYDQVGGGFHRYATDRQWLVPHFEKMLYNQAQLSRVYLHAFEITGFRRYRRTVEQTLDYVLRDMTSKQGVFFSATDADSEGTEGEFFIWSVIEFENVLSQQESKLAINLFAATQSGNFEGKNILNLPIPLNEFAQQQNLNINTLESKLDIIRQKLYLAREKRIHPLRDEKVITAWNAMMITSMTEAALILDQSDYLQAAIKAAEFLWKHSKDTSDQLFRINLNQQSSIPAVLNDYAYLAEAFIRLYDVTENKVWLQRAELLVSHMIDQFWDKENDGFFNSHALSDTPMIIRSKSATDGAIASGNSVALRTLVQLSQRTGNQSYQTMVSRVINAYLNHIQQYPTAYSYMLTAINEHFNNSSFKIQYAANGAVKIWVSRDSINDKQHQFKLNFAIDNGWHINSHQVAQENLIPTNIKVNNDHIWALTSIQYPEPEYKTLAIFNKPLALYSKKIQISGILDKHNHNIHEDVKFSVSLQACNQELCLPPETVTIY